MASRREWRDGGNDITTGMTPRRGRVGLPGLSVSRLRVSPECSASPRVRGHPAFLLAHGDRATEHRRQRRAAQQAIERDRLERGGVRRRDRRVGVDTQGGPPRKDYSVEYQGWSKVFVHPRGEPGGFIFRREGLMGWRLVAVKMD